MKLFFNLLGDAVGIAAIFGGMYALMMFGYGMGW